MKRIYQRLHVYALFFFSVAKDLFLTALGCLTLSFISHSQELVFKNPVLQSGQAGLDNAVYRFPNVRANLDVLVKIKKRSASNVILQNIDVTEFGWDKAFQPQIGISGGIVSGVKDWWMEFEISFVTAGTSTSANVSKFNMTSLDVDGDGYTIREYVEIYKAMSYVYEGLTQLTYTSLSGDDDDDDDEEKDYRFLGPIKNYLDIDTAGTAVMVTSKFENKNTIKIRIGARSIGVGTSNAAIRYNSLWFRSFGYSGAVFVPIKLTSFTARLINSNKVSLNWTTSQEKNSSHVTIERSFNGIDFTDAGMVFTMGNSEMPQQYSFIDELKGTKKEIVHYRLKMVDLDGKTERSPVRIIKIDEQKQNAMVTYPNPVTNQLRITLPTSWQDKTVIIEIYNGNGLLVKRSNSDRASQTETLNMQDVPVGVYLLKVSAGNETTTQRIIKSN